MISLPPGCTVTYAVWIDISKLSDEIIDWYKLIGGNTKTQIHWDMRGRKVDAVYVSYGKGKWCHRHNNGSSSVRLHFHGDDVGVATMLLIKFADLVENHNIQEVQERYIRDNVVQEQLD